MNIMKNSFLKSVVAGGLLSSAIMAEAKSVRPLDHTGEIVISQEILDIERAIIAGQGCSKENAYLSVIEGEEGLALNVSFLAFNAQLHTRALADRKSCTLRVPATIQPGYKLQVHQANAQLFRVANSEFRGEAAISHSIMGSNHAITRVDLASAASDSIVVANNVIAESECSTQEQSGFLGANIAVSLQATTNSPEVTVAAEQLTLSMRLVPCM